MCGIVGEKALLKLEQVWSHGCDSGGKAATAPVLSLIVSGGGSETLALSFGLDVLAMEAEAGERLSTVVKKLRQRAALQLSVASALLAKDPACRPTVLHFAVRPHQVFPLSCIVPMPPGDLDVQESSHMSMREGIHRRFNLALDRPFLRVPQSISFKPASQTGPVRLKNVHVGLPPSGIQGGKVHLVQGLYEYCHYMQDKFDDNGWGCMYRSYQTVLSWFRAQHYTSLPIQTHEQIQKLLVKMGDKPPRFVGSKQWIGAMETQMLLDEYLGVTSKVMNVSSGHDLEDKGRELGQHFDTQGTPVPIGMQQILKPDKTSVPRDFTG